MSAQVMIPVRPVKPLAEWNHSCTSQCPSPCEAAQSLLTRRCEPRADTCLAPQDCQ